MLRNIKHPDSRVSLVGALGRGQGLVEADAGYVGGLNGRRMVEFVLGEANGEVLDTVLGTELHEEVGELSQLCGEPFYIVG